MSLRVRIALLSASAVTLAVIVMLVVTLWFARSHARAELDDQLRARAETVETVAINTGVVRGRGLFDLQDTLIQIITDKDQKLFKSSVELPVSKKDLAVAKHKAVESWSDVKVQGVNLRVYTSTARRTPGRRSQDLDLNLAIMVARPLTEIDDTITRLRNSMVVMGLISIFGAGLLGFTVSGRSIRPLRKLSNAAALVAETQNLTHRIEPEGAGELSDLANSFNAMLEALSHSRNQQKQLVADASHELRTPLTSLRTNIELLLREQAAQQATQSAAEQSAQSAAQQSGQSVGRKMLSDEDREQLLQDVRLELTDLTELVAEMVALASYEFEEPEPEPMDLAEVVTAVVQRYRNRSNHEIVCEVESCVVLAAPSLVQRAVSNLIDNAVKWGPPDLPIEVTVADGAVTVRDYGPGIDPQHREHVFERFYRAPTARSMPGSGLGLAIVAQVAQSAGGVAEVLDPADFDGGGTAVRLRLLSDSV